MLTREINVNNAVDMLVDAIKTSEAYRNYIIQRDLVCEHPGLKQQIDEFRMKNFEIQQNYQGDELMEKLEEFMNHTMEFREDPLVDGYLEAELAFCRLIQEVDSRILEELDFN